MAADDLKSSVKEYLEGLPEVILTRLYESPATCLAVFRLLPALAKMLVMSMLYRDESVHISEIEKFVKTKSRKLQVEALQKLKALHLITEVRRDRSIRLSSTFRNSFRSALTTGPANQSFGVPCETDDKHKVDIAFLDKHASDKWEGILHFMVGTESTGDFGNTAPPPGEGVLSLLHHSGLMENAMGSDMMVGRNESVEGMRISSGGFQFLLQSVNAQIWTLLLQYLNMASNLQMDPVDVLNFIFMLGSLELGKDYSLSALSDTQIKMLEDLRDFGLVYQRKSSSRRFYPTRLATTLTSSDASALRSASSSMDAAINEAGTPPVTTTSSSKSLITNNPGDSGFIILETNFRLYAYTDSPLQIAVLNLFVHLKTRFANMITGQITRDSVRRALINGITADQILTYLSVYAHPQMKKNDPVIPPTVMDQIKLWQLEMDRIRASDGFLYTDFSSFQEYDLVATYAAELGVLEWQDPKRWRFFVSREGNAQVVDFVNRRKAK
ncbi:TFIIH/NER complex subunit TFB2 [Sugiyamaella lignohabitans]|uniref:RNA polymerase II transcription factor B subunit 2 n=1 Tax=Sugiyamaella lignohabitans TaxID=796027 RepID=A0A167DBC4_9ASCO|nr:TFIIH/NER complex subunit TFB2 [Sugiyamaella lignohabitans]ANB12712.1 TFIIH/NER complex subunit TFB2 [Sugiyamaella lignohabitans]